MNERPINAISLIGVDAIYESFMACRGAYGADFDRRMADIAATVIGLQSESEKPGGITFNEAAFLMLITEVEEDADPERKDRVNHELRACILWNSLEKPFMEAEIEKLKKVLGDVRGG